MLDPGRKQHIADGTEYISSLLHEELIKIVSEAIVTRMERGVDYRLTARDRWMLELLQDAGYMREALEKEIAAKTRLMLQEVQAAFEDAAVESVAWDDEVYRAAGLEPLPLRQSPTLMRLAERGYQKTKGELVNFTGTMASASQQLFIRECDKAYTLVASGAMSHARAVRQAVETAAGDGIVVRYPSGHRDTIETATGRAVRTGVGQACGDMTLARMDELDWDIVLVSSHLGARTGDGGDNWTNHYYLQSLGFFSRSGSSKKFKALSVCGIGYVDGLLGANCRHSIGPGDGVHDPYAHYDSEENRLREELEQRQRLLERRVRDTKRKVQGLKAAMDKAEDPADREELRGRYQQAARKLQQQNRDYNEFCEANELKQYRERLHIAGWDRKQAASATGAARAAEKAGEEAAGRAVLRPKPKLIEPEDVTEEYIKTAAPGTGKITFDDGYAKGKHEGEIKTAEWLRDKFGGDIQLLTESKVKGEKRPDSIWRGKNWEFKGSRSIGGADKRLQWAFKQLGDNPGGVVLNMLDDVDMEALVQQLTRRFARDEIGTFDLMLLLKGELQKILRYKK